MEIEKKIKEIEERLELIESALITMASWLVQAQTGFGQKDLEGINAILYGTKTSSGESSEATR